MSWKSRFWLRRDQNLADLTSASTARTNLGLGTAATKAASNNAQSTVASVAGSITANHIAVFADTSGTDEDTGLTTSGFLLASNNLSDVALASTARSNLGLGSAATHAATDFLLAANNLSDVTASTAKTNLGILSVDVNLGDASGAASSRKTGTHGLGAMPIIANAYVKNISGGTQNGYAAGEYVQITQGGTSRNDGGSLSMTSTNVTFNVGANGVLIMDAGTFNGVLVGSLGTGHWEIHVLALRY